MEERERSKHNRSVWLTNRLEMPQSWEELDVCRRLLSYSKGVKNAYAPHKNQQTHCIRTLKCGQVMANTTFKDEIWAMCRQHASRHHHKRRGIAIGTHLSTGTNKDAMVMSALNRTTDTEDAIQWRLDWLVRLKQGTYPIHAYFLTDAPLQKIWTFEPSRQNKIPHSVQELDPVHAPDSPLFVVATKLRDGISTMTEQGGGRKGTVLFSPGMAQLLYPGNPP